MISFSKIFLGFLIIFATSATSSEPSISKSPLGVNEGLKIYEYTHKNSFGTLVKAINFGTTITDIIVADKNGAFKSVVLGFDSLRQYLGRGNSLFGSIVECVANRISNK